MRRFRIDSDRPEAAPLPDDLLDVPRITRRVERRRVRVDLSEVLAAVVGDCRPPIEGDGHALTISLPAGPVPLTLTRCD